MLTVVEYGQGEYEFPALIVLGCFDAIHLGHRELLKKAKLQAKINGLDLGVMMFRDGKGGKSGKVLYSFEERCAILEQFNVKFVVAVDFNDEFKAIAPLDFLHGLEDKINVKAYMSGKDFRFGAQAKGKSSTLKNYAEDEENGVWYMPVKDVTDGSDKISTTLIKNYLSEGNAVKANALLGGDFSVAGEVVRGAGRGTSVVGFPTVNVVYPEWKYEIKHGVYSVKCLVGETEYDGVANFGTCPTFDDDRIALEVYLENFEGDLYGQIVTVKFVDFIREIQDFGSAEQLNKQLQNDIKVADGAPSNEIAVADAVEQEPETAVTEAVEPEETVETAETSETAETVEAVENIEEAEETAESAVEEVEAPAEEVTADYVEEAVAEEITEEVAEEPVEEASEEQTESDTVNEEAEISDPDGFDEIAPEELPTEEITPEEVSEEPVEKLPAEEITFEEPAEEIPVEETVIEEQPAENVIAEEVSEEIVDEPVPEETEPTEGTSEQHEQEEAKDEGESD